MLMVHRRTDEGSAALLVVGLNESPLSFTLRRPIGAWTLKLSAGQPDGTGEDGLFPAALDVQEAGRTILLPPFAVAVYLSSGC